MKMLKLMIALLIVSPLAFAIDSSPRFTWTPPTERVDGAPLPQSQIGGYQLWCNGELFATVPNVPEGISSYETEPGSFAVGQHSCYMTTVDSDGLVSGPSNTLDFTVDPAAPNPPGVLAVE